MTGRKPYEPASWPWSARYGDCGGVPDRSIAAANWDSPERSPRSDATAESGADQVAAHAGFFPLTEALGYDRRPWLNGFVGEKSVGVGDLTVYDLCDGFAI